MADKPVKLVCENCLLEILESEDYEPLYDDEADGDPVAHSDMATCIARLREELRIVSRYAARLYDTVGEVADVVSAGLGDATREPAWVNALQRGREGR